MTCKDEMSSKKNWIMVTFTCIFVTVTLILTSLSSIFLTVSLLSEYWEQLSYSEDGIREIAEKKNHTFKRISDGLLKLEMGPQLLALSNATADDRTDGVVYLVAAHGGVNSLCVDISENDWKTIKEDGFNFDICISYLSNDDIISMDSWLDRMRNLAMSCSIVCLILLGCSAPLGILGLIKKQISTIMVTGVMYILAAVFGIFTLAFMHFKRAKPEGYFTNTVLDRDVPNEYLKTRHFAVGWPASLGWAGLGLGLAASLFWLLLAKILRFQVLSPT